jgi:kinesin family member 18/19
MEFQSKGLATGGRKLEEMAQMVAQMEEDGVADEHMKAMWAGQSNVLVAVRVRPLLKHDVIKKSIVRVLDAKVVIIMDPSHDKNDVLRGNRSREKQYAFDYVFEAGSSQQSVYNHTSKFLIHGVLDGFNATVFAYGNTGAGKTHTMIGSTSDPGIMVRIMNDLFHYCHKAGQSQRTAFKITVSFLEVYNENIKDLLSETQEYLDLREDPIAGPIVSGILEIEAKNSDEIMNLLQTGNQRRTQQPTAANEVSSRSHAVFQVVVECKDRAPGTVANIKVGKLSLVDLAGSERAANTKNSGKRLVEGANINRSLLALGNCINALGEKGNKGNFVPYRDSKLTRLLKDSLGGNCRTVMIANISSAESCFEETLNTLKYANRAKNIKTNVQRNVLNVNHHISEYVNLIANLRAEIKILKDQISHAPESPGAGPVGAPGQLLIPPMSPNHKGVPPLHPAAASPLQVLRQPSTPLQSLRDSMRSATSLRATTGEGREVLNLMRQKIVDNFQERMQLRRSLIELEDQNVQNSIEVSKRQMILVNWSGNTGVNPTDTLQSTDLATEVLAHGTPEIKVSATPLPSSSLLTTA